MWKIGSAGYVSQMNVYLCKICMLKSHLEKKINRSPFSSQTPLYMNGFITRLFVLKELFELLTEEGGAPVGNCPADVLAVELTAGGLTPEHTSYVCTQWCILICWCSHFNLFVYIKVLLPCYHNLHIFIQNSQTQLSMENVLTSTLTSSWQYFTPFISKIKLCTGTCSSMVISSWSIWVAMRNM